MVSKSGDVGTNFDIVYHFRAGEEFELNRRLEKIEFPDGLGDGCRETLLQPLVLGFYLGFDTIVGGRDLRNGEPC